MALPHFLGCTGKINYNPLISVGKLLVNVDSAFSFFFYCLIYVIFLGLAQWLSSKKFTCNAGEMDLIPGWEDPLEKEMATHSSIFAWKIP